jgi:hypothetical protein
MRIDERSIKESSSFYITFNQCCQLGINFGRITKKGGANKSGQSKNLADFLSDFVSGFFIWPKIFVGGGSTALNTKMIMREYGHGHVSY